MKKNLYLLFFIFVTTPFSYSQTGWVTLNPLPPAQELNSVTFLNENTGFACGFASMILKTTNSGINWSVLKYGDLGVYYKIKFINDNTGYVTANNGIILKTVNGGNNWQTISTGGNADYYALHCFDANNIIIGGTGGTIKRSTNGGTSWENVSISVSEIVFCFNFINPSTGFAGFGAGIF